MTLLTTQRILIGTAVDFFTYYGLWEFAGRGGPGAPAGGARRGGR